MVVIELNTEASQRTMYAQRPVIGWCCAVCGLVRSDFVSHVQAQKALWNHAVADHGERLARESVKPLGSCPCIDDPSYHARN